MSSCSTPKICLATCHLFVRACACACGRTVIFVSHKGPFGESPPYCSHLTPCWCGHGWWFLPNPTMLALSPMRNFGKPKAQLALAPRVRPPRLRVPFLLRVVGGHYRGTSMQVSLPHARPLGSHVVKWAWLSQMSMRHERQLCGTNCNGYSSWFAGDVPPHVAMSYFLLRRPSVYCKTKVRTVH